MRWTRRECAKGLLAAAAAGSIRAARSETLALENEHLRIEVEIGDGKVLRIFHNRRSDETVELGAPEFAFEFLDGVRLSSRDLQASVAGRDGASLSLLFKGGDGYEVRVQYELPAGKAYLRKRISLRRLNGASRIVRADLEDWRGVRRPWRVNHYGRLPWGSHPIFCDTMWAGVEFVAAFNEYDSSGFVLRSRPGGKRIGSEWLALHSAVVGAAEPDRVRDSFLSYIDDIRHAPPRLVACYNAWWTLPLHVIQEDQLALFRELKAKFADRHGVFFDFVATDEGWTDPHSIWKVDRRNLPQGFDGARRIVESAGGRLGLWMSPSANYPRSCDYEWAEKSGYTVIRPQTNRHDWRRGLSLADPKYLHDAKEQLQCLIREEGFAHIKYDGFTAAESQPHHDLLAGEDSVEPLAEALVELYQAAYEANPRLFSEPTCLNSRANYISPWILRYADSVWGDGGTDCPPGISPAPVYRESATTGREYYVFSSLDEVWLPQNALQYFDIVHCDDTDGFANHAAMAFGRGRFFISTYANPKFMSDDDWHIYAGLLKWARANQNILQNTVVIPSRLEMGEPYVYAHWLGQRGILAVRNPSNETRDFSIDLRKSGAPTGLADGVCYTQYPYRRGIASGLKADSRITLRMAPWELLYLEIVPPADLKEPVVIGARWYSEGDGRTAVVPDRGVREVHLLSSGAAGQTIAVTPRPESGLRGEILSRKIWKLAEAEWVVQDRDFPCHMQDRACSDGFPRGTRLPGVGFDMESLAVVPGDGEASILLLVEFPGEKHYPSRCSVTVNEEPQPLKESHSFGHIVYRNSLEEASALRIRRYLSEWSWYICKLKPGECRVRFSGAAAHAHARFGVWVWLETDLRSKRIPIAAACPEPSVPQYQPEHETEGICLQRPWLE